MTLAVNIAQGGSNNVTFRNRIINGAMVIDQRNNGASVTPASTPNSYTLDRWQAVYSQNSKFSVQQNAGSVTPPAGYKYYLGVTSLSAYSLTATDYFDITQNIEGYNWADLGFGASGASSVTFSFWVRSSLTGTFSGTLVNSNDTQVYPFSYVINSANTWEQKSITIAGSTTGTWNSTNGVGAKIQFCLGLGSNYLGTLNNTWNAGTLYGATGQVNLVANNGATFYITGVQLEAGTTASPFEYRQYGTELALCQRYCCIIPVSSAGIADGIIGPWGANYNATNGRVWYKMPVTMRATPSVSLTGNQYSLIGVNDTATATNANFHYSNEVISFDGTSISSSSATGQPLAYRGGGLITAEL